MKKYLFLVFLVSFSLVTKADEHQVGIGIRGGIQWMMPQSEQTISKALSPVAHFDCRYSYLGLCQRDFYVGFTTGLSVGYGNTKISGAFEQQYVNTDYLTNDILYTTSSSFESAQQSLSVELPTLLALRASGFVFRLGPKLQLSPWINTRQNLQNPIIDAYYAIPNVHVVNQLVTGLVTDEQSVQIFTKHQPLLQVAVGVEIGYEWNVHDEHCLGLTAYVDFGVWNNYNQVAEPVIAVAPITNPQMPVPVVTVNEATTSLIKSYHPLQIGISFYYAFCTLDRRSLGLRR